MAETPFWNDSWLHWLSLSILCASIWAWQQSQTKAVVGGTLIDGSGKPPVRNSVILIGGDRIEALGTVDSLKVPSGYGVTDGMRVLPGLWDMRTHFPYLGGTNTSAWNREKTAQHECVIMPTAALQALMAGVTSARDLGAPPESILAVKARIDKGEIAGPTIYASGPQLDHEPADRANYYRWKISNPTDAREKVKKLADLGGAWIKVTNEETLPVDDIRAIVSAAHSRGLRVTGYARTLGEIRRALAGGVAGLEHINFQEPEYPAEIMTSVRDRTARGVFYWTPTVYSPLANGYLQVHPEILDDPANYEGVPPMLAAELRAEFLRFQPKPTPNDEAIVKRKFSQLREAGVELLVGTDTGNPGVVHSQSMWQEMDA